MGRVADYWVDERIQSQRATPRTPAALSPMRELSIDLIGTPAEVRRRGGIIPSWVVFGMILLAGAGVCISVTIRTYAQGKLAAQTYNKAVQDLDDLKLKNARLKEEVRRLKGDARTIELAARSQLNMARPNEIIVPGE